MQWLNPVVAILARMVRQSVAPLNAQRTRRIVAPISCAPMRWRPQGTKPAIDRRLQAFRRSDDSHSLASPAVDLPARTRRKAE